jgi:hypothetical protein
MPAFIIIIIIIIIIIVVVVVIIVIIITAIDSTGHVILSLNAIESARSISFCRYVLLGNRV